MADGSQMYLIFDSSLSDICCGQSWILSSLDHISYTRHEEIEHWYYGFRTSCLEQEYDREIIIFDTEETAKSLSSETEKIFCKTREES